MVLRNERRQLPLHRVHQAGPPIQPAKGYPNRPAMAAGQMAGKEVAARDLRIYGVQVHPGYVNILYGSPDKAGPGIVTHMRFLLRREVPAKQGHSWAMPCQPYCGLNLNRPHATDLTCPIRQIRAGKMPDFFPVRMKTLMINRHPNIGVGRVKTVLLKTVLTLLGVLSF